MSAEADMTSHRCQQILTHRARVRAVLRPLLEERALATCALVDLEVLYSSRKLQDHEGVLEERRALDSVPLTPHVMASAIELQHALARRRQHHVPIPDAIISAAARTAGLVVMHYDSEFERIADIGGAPQEWVSCLEVRSKTQQRPRSPSHRIHVFEPCSQAQCWRAWSVALRPNEACSMSIRVPGRGRNEHRRRLGASA